MKCILELMKKRIYVIDITFGINENIFSGNEQQKVYLIQLLLSRTKNIKYLALTTHHLKNLT